MLSGANGPLTFTNLCNIVAVHGLEADTLDTWSWAAASAEWTSFGLKEAPHLDIVEPGDTEKVLWLVQFLPLDLPDARIMLFEHE